MVQAFFFTAVATYRTTLQMIAFLVDRGFPPIEAALAFGVAGMPSIGGVMTAEWATVRYGYKRSVVVSFAGTSQGARGPMISALNARIFASGRVSSIYGLIFMLMSLGSAGGAWLSGLLHDWTGDYVVGFFVAVFAVLLALAPFTLTRRLVDAKELPPPAS